MSVVVLAGCGGGSGAGSDFPGDDGGSDAPYTADSSGPIFSTGDGSAHDAGLKCTPRTCAQEGATCGPVADGCGGKIDSCGTCTAPESCGGGGVPSQCGGSSACIPATCATLSASCGPQGDGCGKVIDCGDCNAPQTCGGGGVASACGGTAGCVAATTCPTGMNCGFVSDGCGGVVQCGTACAANESCGGGGKPNVCGGVNVLPDGGIVDGGLTVCTPLTQAQACTKYSANCGVVSDDCGGTVTCGSLGGNCAAPETCGGGGTPSQCGGAAQCVPTVTACPAAMNCGVLGNGCGGTVKCGTGTCAANELCGGGGSPNVCGAKNVLPDGADVDGGLNICTPLTNACGTLKCGSTGDGCGNLISCGTCTGQDSCGGGGTPGQCGHPVCTPATPAQACAAAKATCGEVGDGCGALVTCGSCTLPETCGGAGSAGQCGKPSCVPLTATQACTAAKANCGPVADGCGGEITSCGVCNSPAICGGSGVASQCGDGTDGGSQCQGLQCDQVFCSDGGTTSVTGIVYDPAGKNPVYNAVVFVPPTTQLNDFAPNVQCSPCADQETSLISYTTGADGKFTLTDVPVVDGGTTPIVIQIGRWRREIQAPISACTNNALTVAQTHLPKTHTQVGDQATDLRDDIPLMAIATGNADPFECLLLNMGIDSSEFVNPDAKGSPTGRVHYYTTHDTDPTSGNAVNGKELQTASPNLGPGPDGSELWGTSATNSRFNNYDVVLLPCEAEAFDHGDDARKALGAYADLGGRVFVTHYSYEWAAPQGNWASNGGTEPANEGAPWGSQATWDENQPFLADPSPDWCQYSNETIQEPTTITGTVNQSFAKGAAFAQWMQNVGATTTLGQLVEQQARHDVDSIPSNSAAQEWIQYSGTDTKQLIETYVDNNNNIQCVPAQSQYLANYGEEAHSGASVQHMTFDTPLDAGLTDAGVPGYCGRVVYSDFHVSASALTTSTTFPKSCIVEDLTAQEKALEFMLFDLTSCVSPDNLPPITQPTCTKKTCPVGACGDMADGCGGVLTCPTCTSGSCIDNQCVNGCQPESCASQKLQCGLATDGCGNTLPSCGTCPSGESCVAGSCVAVTCTPLTCSQLGLACGPAGNGCGGTQSCPACVSPQTCGGGGVAGQCGQSDADVCKPISCSSQGLACGPAGDGCGNLVDCGDCPSGQTCGGGGVAGQCGAPNCTPLTCATLKLSCGPAGNGCGGTLDCGTCPAGQTCGGGGAPGVCGALDANACVPLTCAAQQIACGQAGDGCGSLINCPPCPSGQTCGGGGVVNQCGAPNCTPKTCAQLNATCGQVADGCGNLTASCGDCTGNTSCGGGGTSNQCGAPKCTARTCAQAGANCGPVADGCGNIISCGECTGTETCGGGGTASVCGGGIK